MTESHILQWIKNELSPYINIALAEKPVIYTEDWIAAMTMRETGFLIARYVSQGMKSPYIHPIIKGDYCQRTGETEKSYHGFGYMQIDIASYPDFVKSGNWKDPLHTYKMAIAVLESKRNYLEPKYKEVGDEMMHRAITAAYNCGEGNVSKALREGKDADVHTYNHDYSKEVWRFREIYKNL